MPDLNNKTILGKLSGESIVWKISEGEMFIKTIPIFCLQIFWKIILNSKGIVKSIIDPDTNRAQQYPANPGSQVGQVGPKIRVPPGVQVARTI